MKSTPEPSLRFLIGWQIAAVGLVLLLPAAMLGDWPWQLRRNELVSYAALVAALVAAALLHLVIRGRSSGWLRLGIAVGGSAVLLSTILVALFAIRSNASRTVLIAMFAITLGLLPLPFLIARFRIVSVALMGMAMIGTGALAVKRLSSDAHAVAAARVQSSVGTNLYNLQLISHTGPIAKPAVRGGGLAHLGERVLLVTGDGSMYLLDTPKGKLSANPLSYRVPLNGEEFAAAVGGEYAEPRHSSEYGLDAPPGVQTWRFRTAGVLVQPLGDRARIFASHHYWNDAGKCFVIRVSTIDVRPDGALFTQGEAQWRTLFESTPCLPVTGKDAKRGKNPFQGEEMGGDLELLDEHTLLLTIGDMSFSGIESWQILAQDPAASYGKTVKIDIESGRHEIFTLGHRNPQGLVKDREGNLWMTEHGAKGGDELNLLQQGANYGWPAVTYGTDYQTFAWPLNPQQGRHEGFAEPVHAWVPSIGISPILQLSGRLFPAWAGDLLVGSLSTRSIYRLRIKDKRVIFAEPIPISHRVRDLLELADGRILVWTDEVTLVEISPTAEMTGELLYASLCQTCHWIYDGESHRAGPDLYGIVGKEVASASGFSYSQALEQFGGDWTPERLDRFLAEPQAVVPGTSMAFEGVEAKKDREMLIEHLRRARK